jgi:hypothetical protein
MRAEEMRKITEQATLEALKIFWEEFKNILFEGMKRQAECRCDSITIKYGDKLSETKQGCSWINYKPFRDGVQQELESLGYKFSYNDAKQGEFVTIAW